MFKIYLNQDQVQTIANALADAPFKTSAPVIQELQKQITEQQQNNANQPAGTTENSTT